MIFKEVFCENDDGKADHEEVPQEDLYEDGELSDAEVRYKIINRVLYKGDWILVRRVD